MIVWAVPRIVVSTAALVTLYYLLPLDHSSAGAAVTILVIGLVVFIGLVALQVRSIIRSPFPGLRAIEALATSVPLSCCCSPAPTSSWPRCRPATSAGG
jgi:voltage-gated potassium channel